MLIRSQIYRVIYPLDHIRAVAGQQRSDIDVAFLQVLVRDTADRMRVVVDDEKLRLSSSVPAQNAPQAFELIVNFFSTSIERRRQSRID